MKKSILIFLLIMSILTACSNSDIKKVEKLINEIDSYDSIEKIDNSKITEIDKLIDEMSLEELEEIKNLREFRRIKDLINDKEKIKLFNDCINNIKNNYEKIGTSKIEYDENMEKSLNQAYDSLSIETRNEVQEKYTEALDKIEIIKDKYKQQEDEIEQENKRKLEEEHLNKQNELKNKLSRLKRIHDDFSEINSYYPRSIPSDNNYWYYDVRSFVLPYIQKNGEDYVLKVIVNYYGYDWLFISDIIIKIDGNFYSPYEVVEPKFDRNVADDGYVSESDSTTIAKLDNTLVPNNYYEIFQKIINSKSSVVRFYGSKGQEDLIISDKDKSGIREVLEAWNLIVELNNSEEI